jgi:hypothetical protein
VIDIGECNWDNERIKKYIEHEKDWMDKRYKKAEKNIDDVLNIKISDLPFYDDTYQEDEYED